MQCQHPDVSRALTQYIGLIRSFLRRASFESKLQRKSTFSLRKHGFLFFKGNMSIEKIFSKQPSEKYPIAIDYTNEIPIGTSLVSATGAAFDLTRNASDPTVLVSATGVVSGAQASLRVQAGQHGDKYKITFTTYLSDGSILEDDVIMEILAE